MKHIYLLTQLAILPMIAAAAGPVPDKHPGDWKTWVIASAQEHQVPPPPGTHATSEELGWVRQATAESHPAILSQIRYWDAGPPRYRWMEMIANRQINGQSVSPFFARAPQPSFTKAVPSGQV